MQGITWDDACIFCGKNECAENTLDYDGVAQTRRSSGQPTKGCFISVSECSRLFTNKNTACDLTLHVVWTGTDSSGRALLSSASRYSAFPSQEIKDTISRNLPSFPSVF